MNNVTIVFCDTKYHRFIKNIIGMKFNYATDKAYEINEIRKNLIFPTLAMFLLFLQSYYYSILYILYFCIFVFEVFLIQFD